MKFLLFLLILLPLTNISAQIDQSRLVGVEITKRYLEMDTIPVVVNIGDKEEGEGFLWYLNGKQVDGQVFQSIANDKIEKVEVKKESSIMDQANYNGSIYITTKADYTPKMISLSDLKSKYLNVPEGSSTLFMLEGEVITIDHDNFMVDESYLLKIEYQHVENIEEKLDLIVVGLITRTKENLEKVNTIRIKGSDPYGVDKLTTKEK